MWDGITPRPEMGLHSATSSRARKLAIGKAHHLYRIKGNCRVFGREDCEGGGARTFSCLPGARINRFASKFSQISMPRLFDPAMNFEFSIATEVLSEGVNLHRSNIVFNYDIPWNPTRLIQRVGRVNRVDTKFDTIHTYNFFPTEESNDLIKLKEAAEAKIHAFIEMLGADARLLTEGEEIKSHDLFAKLNSPRKQSPAKTKRRRASWNISPRSETIRDEQSRAVLPHQAAAQKGSLNTRIVSRGGARCRPAHLLPSRETRQVLPCSIRRGRCRKSWTSFRRPRCSSRPTFRRSDSTFHLSSIRCWTRASALSNPQRRPNMKMRAAVAAEGRTTPTS